MRIWINNGKLMEYRSISDPHVYFDAPQYDTFLEYQVYRDGEPMTGNYRGEAHVSKGVMVIGDPVYQANLTELRIAEQPTQASAERFEGFLRALDEKRKPSSKGLAKYENKSTDWWAGYRDGWEQKDARKREKNPHQIAADFVARHADDRTWRQRIPGGTDRPPCEFERSALAAGLAVELEHTTDPAIALEIAMDHLDEDPHYYDKHHEKPKRRRAANPGSPHSRTQRISRRVGGA